MNLYNIEGTQDLATGEFEAIVSNGVDFWDYQDQWALFSVFWLSILTFFLIFIALKK